MPCKHLLQRSSTFITDLCFYAKSTFKRNLTLLKKKYNEYMTSFKGHSSSVAINCHQMRCLRLLHPVPAPLFNAASGAKNSAQPTNTHLPCQSQPTHTQRLTHIRPSFATHYHHHWASQSLRHCFLPMPDPWVRRRTRATSFAATFATDIRSHRSLFADK